PVILARGARASLSGAATSIRVSGWAGSTGRLFPADYKHPASSSDHTDCPTPPQGARNPHRRPTRPIVQLLLGAQAPRIVVRLKSSWLRSAVSPPSAVLGNPSWGNLQHPW